MSDIIFGTANEPRVVLSYDASDGVTFAQRVTNVWNAPMLLVTNFFDEIRGVIAIAPDQKPSVLWYEDEDGANGKLIDINAAGDSYTSADVTVPPFPASPNNLRRPFDMIAGSDSKRRIVISGPGSGDDQIWFGTEEAADSGTFTYDSEQRLSSIIGKYNDSQKLSHSYTYNNAQQIVSISKSIAGVYLTYPATFEYDERDQLKKENFNNYPDNYVYDKAQNRLSKRYYSSSPETYSYVIANKLTNIHIGVQNADNQYIYDIAGNVITNIKDGIISEFFYNAQNKLVKIELANNDYYEFTYDSQNRRIAISTNGISRYTIHDGNIPIGETDSSGDVTRWFVRGVGIAEGTGDMVAEIIGSDSSAKAIFYLSNHRGDTMMVYRDNNGTDTLVAKYRYDAFGNQRSSYCVVNESENAPRFLFSTKEYLSDAQLYLYAYRVYDPIAGRWTQRDPIDYQDSINLYQFCGNNPVNGLDEYGLFASSWHFIISFKASRDSGSSYSRSIMNAIGSVIHDFTGTQGTDAKSANSHGMAGTKANGKMQTKEEAQKGNKEFVESSMKSGNTGAALHATEDPFAGGHNFSEWDKFDWLDGATYEHIWDDIYPSKDDLAKAYQADKKLLSKHKK